MDNLCIILQGYSFNPTHLTKLITNYNSQGINKIIISTYKPCVNLPELQKLNCKVFFNDTDRKNLKDARTKSYRINKKKVNLQINFEEEVFPDSDTLENCKKYQDRYKDQYDYIERCLRTINYKLKTTNEGLRKAQALYPECEYYMVSRADLEFYNLPERFNELNEKINVNSDIFENKIVPCRVLKHNILWDLWIYGKKNDMINYFNVPYIKVWQDLPVRKKHTKVVESFFNRKYYCLKTNTKENEFNYDEFCNKYVYVDFQLKFRWMKHSKIYQPSLI